MRLLWVGLLATLQAVADANALEGIVSAGLRLRELPTKENLSLKEFLNDYSRTSNPVVLKGAAKAWPATGTWDLARLTKICSSKPLVRQCEGDEHHVVWLNQSDEGNWASVAKVSLAALEIRTVGDLLSAVEAGKEVYLHDQSIDVLCPELLSELRASKYFPVNFKQQLAAGWGRSRHGCASTQGQPPDPSLFVGPPGSQSGLHSDMEATRFSMAVVKGTKWFRLVEPTDSDRLYPIGRPWLHTEEGYHQHFAVDAFHPDFNNHPEFANTIVWEANVTEGDIIFIPEKWPHQVMNLDTTIAVSHRFIDEHNFGLFKKHQQYQILDAIGEGEKNEAELVAREMAAMSLPEFFPVVKSASIHADHQDEHWADFFLRNQLEHQPVWDKSKYVDAWYEELLQVEERFETEGAHPNFFDVEQHEHEEEHEDLDDVDDEDDIGGIDSDLEEEEEPKENDNIVPTYEDL